MIAIHIETVRRMRRQPGIVVGFFDQVLGAAPPAVEPDHKTDGVGEVGDKDRGTCTGWFRITGTAHFPPSPLPRAPSRSAGRRTGIPCSILPADGGIRIPYPHPSSSTVSIQPAAATRPAAMSCVPG